MKPKKPNGFKKSEGNFEKTKKPDNDNEDDNDDEDEEDNDNNNNVVVGDSCVDGLQEIIDFYNANIGLITPYGLEVLVDYAKEMDYDVIIYAMQKSVEANIRTIQYIKGTLNNWQENFRKSKSEPDKKETEEEAIARKTKALEEAMKNDKW